jgi:hypothetical protein
MPALDSHAGGGLRYIRLAVPLPVKNGKRPTVRG